MSMNMPPLQSAHDVANGVRTNAEPSRYRASSKLAAVWQYHSGFMIILGLWLWGLAGIAAVEWYT